MKRSFILVFTCAMLVQSIISFGQSTTLDGLERTLKGFEVRHLLAQENLRTKMKRGLTQLSATYQQAGNLDGVLEVRALLETFDGDEPLPPSSSTELQKIHQSYLDAMKDIDAEAAKSLRTYLQTEGRKLDQLVRQLTKDKRMDEAIAANEALARVKEVLAEQGPSGELGDAQSLQALQDARRSALQKLACYIPFDGQRQGFTPDLGSHRRHGQLVSASLGLGVRKQALLLDGKGAGVELPASDFLPDAAGPMTAAMWLQLDGDQPPYARVIHKINLGQRGPGFVLCILDNKLTVASLSAGVRGTSWKASTALKVDAWIHVAVSVDVDQTVTAYVNGRQIELERTKLTWASHGGDQFWLGRRGTEKESDSDRGLRGKIDEFFWFDGVLTDVEVQAIAARPTP